MEPLVFAPYLRPMVWGERRLGSHLGKPLPDAGRYGEAWEISGHRSHVSVVAEGPQAGTSLAELCTRHAADFYGTSPASAVFPLLIKLLDAHDWLSVQVHPDDRLAAELTPGEAGKTEAWIVLHAEPGSRIWAGLRDGVTPGDLKQGLEDGSVVNCLHAIEPKPGDCIFLRAGTVHAVGGGVLFAEVQQTSDATFRLYDWDRVQPDGTRRKLHVSESLAAIDWSAGPVQPVKPQHLPGLPEGVKGEHLVDCEFFHFDRYQVRSRFPITSGGELTIWMVLDGKAELRSAGGYSRHFQRGETTIVPAAAANLEWCPEEGPATLLSVRIP